MWFFQLVIFLSGMERIRKFIDFCCPIVYVVMFALAMLWQAGLSSLSLQPPTIADIALFPAFALSRDIGIDHESFPTLRRWMRRLRNLPGFSAMPGIPDCF